MKVKPISISIVSHGQFELIKKLLTQLQKYSELIEKIIITINLPEEIPDNKFFKSSLFKWIYNKSPRGFGYNHNNAFKECRSEYFCIMNPDILINNDIFSELLYIKKKYNVGILGPALIDSLQKKQVNARKFPSLISLVYNFNKVTPEYFNYKKNNVGFTDWIGGMFMLISVNDFKLLEGFDERYFLYCEDIDICLTAKNKGLSVAEFGGVTVIHDARRESHKRFKYFSIHFLSFIKYFYKNKNFILNF